jgi:predicted DCC family thiol-disulfide oxidoreductase YuxK
MKRDRDHRVDWIDIALPTFHAEAFGLDATRVHEVMHARTADGQVFTEVQAFIHIWKALPPTLMTTAPVALLKIPGMLPLANVLYRLFARNRYRLTGRCTPDSCDPAVKR